MIRKTEIAAPPSRCDPSLSVTNTARKLENVAPAIPRRTMITHSSTSGLGKSSICIRSCECSSLMGRSPRKDSAKARTTAIPAMMRNGVRVVPNDAIKGMIMTGASAAPIVRPAENKAIKASQFPAPFTPPTRAAAAGWNRVVLMHRRSTRGTTATTSSPYRSCSLR